MKNGDAIENIHIEEFISKPNGKKVHWNIINSNHIGNDSNSHWVLIEKNVSSFISLFKQWTEQTTRKVIPLMEKRNRIVSQHESFHFFKWIMNAEK